MASDLSELFNFINLQVAGAGPFGDGLHYRDLGNYYTAKKDEVSNDRNDVKDLAKNALIACGLDGTHLIASTLNNAGREKVRAAAAAVLAMSIIKNTKAANLRGHYQRLMRGTSADALRELKNLLTYGDVETAKGNSKISLKNFTSAGTQSGRYKLEAVAAFARSTELIEQARSVFVAQASQPLPAKVATAFQRYFGAPGTSVATHTLAWGAPSAGVAAPVFGAAQVSARAVVREVVVRLSSVYRSPKAVRLYFGGKSIDDGTRAYVSGDVDPTKVHVAERFFARKTTGLDSQAGTLLHEMTHTWALTDDHEYDPLPCRNLVASNRGQALTNADNYAFFMEEAFG